MGEVFQERALGSSERSTPGAGHDGGAHDVGGHSIGCTIELPNEQHGNPYLTTEIGFRHFFARKVVLVRYSQAFVMMPGGYGTLDELFETATLIQTGKMPGFPMVLMGTEFAAFTHMGAFDGGVGFGVESGFGGDGGGFGGDGGGGGCGGGCGGGA